MMNLLAIFLDEISGGEKWLFKDGKINTVVAILLIIWAGIIVYLLLTQKKVNRLEKEVEEMKKKGSAE